MADQTLDQRLQTMRRIAETVNTFNSPEVQKLAFQTLIGALDDPGPSNAPPGPSNAPPAAPAILTRALAAFDSAGDERMHSEVLAQALGVADQWALAELFRPYGVRSRPNKFMRGGVERRGYDRADIVEAIERCTA